MNRVRSDSIRQSAYFLSVMLRLAAVGLLGIDLYVAYDVNKTASSIGLSASHDPAPWVILVGGIVVVLMLAGVGEALALLCAVYDRQASRVDLLPEVIGSTRQQPLAREPKSEGKGRLWEQLTRERHIVRR